MEGDATAVVAPPADGQSCGYNKFLTQCLGWSTKGLTGTWRYVDVGAIQIYSTHGPTN